MKQFVLCYIETPWAFFTTQPLEGQWGDDWDDSSRSCNAGWPYQPNNSEEDWQIMRLAFEGPFKEVNDSVSVREINAGHAAWLVPSWCDSHKVVIYAGITPEEFTERIESVGGNVYTSLSHLTKEEKVVM